MHTSTQPITADALIADFRATLARERREARARQVRRAFRTIKVGIVAGAFVGLAITATVRTLTDADVTPRETPAASTCSTPVTPCR